MRVNGRLAIGLLFLVAVALPSMASASNPCGSVPSSQNSLTLYCIPITVASSSATSNAQVMLTFNALAYQSYLSGSLQNIYVYNSISGNTIPAWIEGNILNEQQTTSLNTASNVIIWLNDPNANIISTSADTNYYIGVGSTSTNFFTSGNNIGEAPQLSSSYAEYDNGASVFPTLYQNFAGTSTPSGWSQSGGTVNNGYTGSTGGSYMLTSSAYSTNSNQILDILGNSESSSSGTAGGAFYGYALLSNPDNYNSAWWVNGQTPDANRNGGTQTSGTMNSPLNVDTIFSVQYGASGATFSYNYGSSETVTGDYYSSGMSVGSNQGSSSTSDTLMQWVRIRTYPPNGTMPAQIKRVGGCCSCISCKETTWYVYPIKYIG